MLGVKLADVEKSFGPAKVIHGVSLEIERGEFAVFVGPSGCGKSTLLRMIAGLEETTGRADRHRGPRRHPGGAGQARRRDGLPVLRALSAPDGVREHGLQPPPRPPAAPGGRGQGRRGRPHPAARGAPAEEALAALRRPAPARRDRPRHRARAQGLPLRRAALQPRCRASGADAARARPAAQADRRDDDLRDPRPGRGDDARRQDLRAAVGRRAAVGAAARALRRPRQPLRRRLHRLAEP